MAKTLPVEDAGGADVVKAVKKGALVIIPTDTVYCIACNALLPEAVERLNAAKRPDALLSVVAPSKKWIDANFNVKKAFLDKLPGPFTYVLKPKKEAKGFSSAIGVRLFEHPVMKAFEKAKLPLVCASVNISGTAPAVDVKKISPMVTEKADFIIDAGTLANNPSTVIDFTGKVPLIVKRQAF
ncbi:MAG TPA: L-threonylcarbamoyladenylate synthase [Nanoarchaeota archaeon]|nr:L-threonylcarbamoyladenylate synthase [Nanoarchaeota archaeon]